MKSGGGYKGPKIKLWPTGKKKPTIVGGPRPWPKRPLGAGDETYRYDPWPLPLDPWPW